MEHDALKRAAALEAARVQQAPDDTQALYRLGLAYLALGEAAKAVAPLKALVQKDAEAIDGKILLSKALRLSGQAEQAKAILDSAIAAVPYDAALRAERGLLARLLDETDVAIEQYTKAVELSPNDAELRFNLGEALHKRGKLEAAIASYREALRINPQLIDAQVNLGKALADKGLYGQAKEILTSAAKSSLGETEAHYNLGVILMREGNAIAAIGEFQRTIAVNPKHSPAHNN